MQNLTAADALIYDPGVVNLILAQQVNTRARVIEQPNLTAPRKAVKDQVEMEHWERCQISDGLAMVKFIRWLKTAVGKERITELSAAAKVNQLRMADPLCIGPSFPPIVAYREHAAMMHYRPTPETTYELAAEGLLLVDSGGQYYSGTTDITRTIVLGQLNAQARNDFTWVLKSHIALATAKFLYGTTGSNIDIMARAPLWQHGIDYKCGTGHGVGFFLNVHEGPQTIRQTLSPVKLEANMIVTNEPGIYREGKHGIRTENMLRIVRDESNEFGQFMKFQTLTVCPIDTAGVNPALLSKDEIQWLNRYHQYVYAKLSPHLTEAESIWLAEATRPLSL